MSKKPMQKFMDWLQYKVTPAVQKFTERLWVHGFSAGIVKCLPFILTGCLIFFYNVVQPYFPNILPNLERGFQLYVQHAFAAGGVYDGLPGNGLSETSELSGGRRPDRHLRLHPSDEGYHRGRRLLRYLEPLRPHRYRGCDLHRTVCVHHLPPDRKAEPVQEQQHHP
ncbi:MAG: hypothetical protein ACLVJH_16060 [Faecalibacterium prausnitzii]